MEQARQTLSIFNYFKVVNFGYSTLKFILNFQFSSSVRFHIVCSRLIQSICSYFLLMIMMVELVLLIKLS